MWKVPLYLSQEKEVRLKHDNQTDFHDILPGGLSQAGIYTGAKGRHFKKTSARNSERIKTAALIVVFP